MADKKLKYREVPNALWFTITTLWRISPGYVIAAAILEILNRAVTFVQPILLAAVISGLPRAVVAPATRWHLVFLIVLSFVFPLVDTTIRNRINWWQAEAEFKVITGLRQRFYMAYARIPYELYEKKEVIDSYNVAETFLMRLTNFGSRQLFQMFGAVVTFIGAIIALFSVHWSVVVLYLLVAPFALYSGLRYNRLQNSVRRKNQTIRRQIWSLEALFYPARIKELRVYNLAKAVTDRVEKLSRKEQKDDLELSRRLDKINLSTSTLSSIAELVASLVALQRIVFRGSPLGTFVLAQQFASRATSSLNEAFSQLREFDENLYGFAEFSYITEVLQPPARSKTKRLPDKLDITINELNYTYPEGQAEVIHDATLSIPQGTHIALVGENGAGKSTLVGLLLGLLTPTSGQIMAGSIDLQDIDEKTWLSNIGVLNQEMTIAWDLSIRDIVWFGDVDHDRGDDDALWAALKAVEMDEPIKKLSAGLDTYLGTWIDEDNGTEFSGGQLQRLAIARAIYRNPDIMILDEPTSAIDALAEKRIFERLMLQRRGRTTIFVSHRFSTVRRADKIAYIDRGRVVEYGTHDELMALSSKYAHMFTVQAEGYK